MASPKEWCLRGILVSFSIAAILCIAFCSNIIRKYQKSGLITILFDSPHITPRGMSLSVPMNPNGIPGVVSIAASQAQSVGSAAATAASSVAGQAQSAVSSAITTVESAMGSVIPKNCSLGVTYFCLGFTDHIDCKELPLNLSSIIPSSVPIIGQPSTLASLDQALAVVKPGTIEGVLIMGLCFAAFSIGPDVICICCLLLFRLGLIPFWGTSRLAAFPRGICSAVCCMPLIALIIILYGILSKLKSMDLPKEITVEAGPASGQILVALICAIFMCIFTIAGWLLNSEEDILGEPSYRVHDEIPMLRTSVEHGRFSGVERN